MTDTARDLIQRLADALDEHARDCGNQQQAWCLASEARQFLATPEPAAGPTDKEIDDLLPLGMAPYSTLCGPIEIRAFARAVLARWGHQPPRPIPLSERLPGSEDMTDEHWSCHWCWWGRRFAGGWEWHQGGNGYGTVPGEFSHWLPAPALPLPEAQP